MPMKPRRPAARVRRNPPLPSKALEQMYRSMVRIRLCEEGFVEPIVSGEIRCPVHLSSGQEASAVGVGHALQKQDLVFGTHRSHGHYLAKGGDLRRMVAEIFCRETGCARGRGGSMHVVDAEMGMVGAAPIVAGTVPLAVGAALGIVIRREKAMAVAFFGDGAMGEGTVWESMNLSAVLRLPMLFVCENNLYSTHMPIAECRRRHTTADSGESLGVPGVSVDGNDVLAVYEAAVRARSRAVRGGGPSFIEVRTYRLRGHVGPDDNIQGTHTDIRPAAELARWRSKDPIPRFERYLLREGGFNRARLNQVRSEIEAEIADAFSFARNSPFPPSEEFEKHVFRIASS
jgi:TPP-dependent pyruvate/acetoin dehydrogenase alpha subunit